MYIYKVKFSNGKKFKVTSATLDECQERCIVHLKNEGDKVEITSPTGKVFTITKKESEYHWRHPGFLFNF